MSFYSKVRSHCVVQGAVHLLLSWVMLLGCAQNVLGAVTGADQNSNDLLQILTLAEQNDPAIKVSEFKKLATDEVRAQAIAGLLPNLSATADYTQTYQNISQSDNDVYGVDTTDYGTVTYGATLTQPLFHWNLFVDLKQSDIYKLRAVAEFMQAEQDLIVRVAEAYLTALSAKDKLDQSLVEQDAVKLHLELAKAQQAMGISPITDYHDAMARMAITRAIVIEAENLYSDALQALMELTGEPIDNIAPLADDLPLRSPEPVAIKEWLNSALENNPGIEVKNREIEISQHEVSKQKAAYYPYADIVGEYENEDADGSLYGGGSEVQTMELSVQLTVPIYKGGMTSSRVRQARLGLKQAKQGLIKAQREVERNTRAAFLGVQTALSQIDALKQSVKSNKLALEAKQEGFKSGLQSSLNVLDAERDLSLVQINYAKARYRFILNTLRLKQATGTLGIQEIVVLNKWFAAGK